MNDQDAELPINNRWMAEAESRAELEALLEAKGMLRRKGSPLQPGSVAVTLSFFSSSANSPQQNAPSASSTAQWPPLTPAEAELFNQKIRQLAEKLREEDKGKRPLSILD